MAVVSVNPKDIPLMMELMPLLRPPSKTDGHALILMMSAK